MDIEGEPRQAFYFGADSKPLPSAALEKLLGKRTQRDFDVIKSQHHRDYTFTEVKGGMKGEKADFMLVRCGDHFRYMPVVSKVKLNKKRVAQVNVTGEDGQHEVNMEHQDRFVYVAPRTFTSDEQKQIQSASIGPVSFKDAAVDLKVAEKALETHLHSMFEVVDEVKKDQDEEMVAEPAAADAGDAGEVDEDLFADSDEERQPSEDPIF